MQFGRKLFSFVPAGTRSGDHPRFKALLAKYERVG